MQEVTFNKVNHYIVWVSISQSQHIRSYAVSCCRADKYLPYFLKLILYLLIRCVLP